MTLYSSLHAPVHAETMGGCSLTTLALTALSLPGPPHLATVTAAENCLCPHNGPRLPACWRCGYLLPMYQLSPASYFFSRPPVVSNGPSPPF